MTSQTQTPELIPWNNLQAETAGYFAARAQGFLRSSYTLADRSGHPLAVLRAQNTGAAFTAGDFGARIEGYSRSGYRMLSGETELARVTRLGESAAALRAECAGRVYEARLRLLRNGAVVRTRVGGELARVSGSLAGRSYEAVFDSGVEGALPVVVLVLHHITALRRRIYLAG